MDSAATAGYIGRSFSFIPLTTKGSCSLLRLYLLGSLHWSPVHKILDDQYSVCDLVVPGWRHAMAGGQAEYFHKALEHMEVHEGLFPHLCEYGAD